MGLDDFGCLPCALLRPERGRLTAAQQKHSCELAIYWTASPKMVHWQMAQPPLGGSFCLSGLFFYAGRARNRGEGVSDPVFPVENVGPSPQSITEPFYAEREST